MSHTTGSLHWEIRARAQQIRYHIAEQNQRTGSPQHYFHLFPNSTHLFFLET